MRGKAVQVALGVPFSSWGGPLLHFRTSLAVSTGGLVCSGRFAQPAPLQAFAVLCLIYDGVEYRHRPYPTETHCLLGT